MQSILSMHDTARKLNNRTNRTDDPEEVLTLSEAAEESGIGKWRLRRAIRSGALVASVPGERWYAIRRRDLVAYQNRGLITQ